MKKIYILPLLLLLSCLFEAIDIQAQRNEWVNQVIIVNGGKFESVPPLTDYVTVQKYDPVAHTVTVFDVIKTQSVQDVIVHDHFAYVAAQDSIIKYDIDTYERVAAIADSGMAKLYMFGNKVLVSKQFPIKRFFLEVLDENLSLLYRVQGISDQCGGITSVGNAVFVAVNGGYAGTEGKLARINSSNWSVMGESNFGPDAVGTWNVYPYDYKIYCVNRTPAGIPDQGSITVYDIYQDTFVNYLFGVNIGDGSGIKDNILYLKMNEGIGSFNLDTKQIVDTTIVPDPGSAARNYILSSAVDYVNGYLYLNIGNRSTYGYGKITNMAGDSIGSFTEGINADAIAIDYRTPVGVKPGQSNSDQITIYPNPVYDLITITLNNPGEVSVLKITDQTGRVILEKKPIGNEKTLSFDFSENPSGIYLVLLTTENGIITGKFIKR